MKEVKWINGIVHSTTFLTRYEQLWEVLPSFNLEDVEFALSLLQIAAYSAQFLLCSTYTADTICGMPISAIRKHCHTLANRVISPVRCSGQIAVFRDRSVLLFSSELRVKRRLYQARVAIYRKCYPSSGRPGDALGSPNIKRDIDCCAAERPRN